LAWTRASISPHAYWADERHRRRESRGRVAWLAAWASYVVERCGARRSIRAKAPADWPYWLVPRSAHWRPNTLPDQPLVATDRIGPRTALKCRPGGWAFQLDAKYKNSVIRPKCRPGSHSVARAFPNAQRPPFVLKGDTLWPSRDYYWGGPGSWTPSTRRLGGSCGPKAKARFVMTEMGRLCRGPEALASPRTRIASAPIFKRLDGPCAPAAITAMAGPRPRPAVAKHPTAPVIPGYIPRARVRLTGRRQHRYRTAASRRLAEVTAELRPRRLSQAGLSENPLAGAPRSLVCRARPAGFRMS